MNIPFFDLKKQYTYLKKSIDDAYTRVMQNGSFILGSELKNFEKEFAEYCGAKYAVGVGSGTEAIHLSLRACGVKAGDEVITVPNTAIPTVMAVLSAKAKPVFVDVGEDCLIDHSRIEEKITENTKAILPVHLYGKSCDMGRIMGIANKHNLFVLEDACQAHGAKSESKQVGTFGIAGCFSFYPTKNLGGYGDGGIVVCNEQTVYERLLLLRNYGQMHRYYAKIEGCNSRLDELQAAFLREKLKHLDAWNSRRREIAKNYYASINNPEIILPSFDENHIYHQFVIRTKNREELKKYLAECGVGTEIHYPVPLHLQEAFSFLNYKNGDFPNAEKFTSEVLSLPIFPELNDDEIKYICDKINLYDVK